MNINSLSIKQHIKPISILLILSLVLSIFLLLPNNNNSKQPFSQIQTICELATLKCYYHNVAQFEQKGGLLDYGHKKLWFEYSGIVRVGIDFSKVKIDPVKNDNVVKIHIPDAKVLSATCDPDSFSESFEETAIFTSIGFEDKAAAFASAQEKMFSEASENSSLLYQSKVRAKKIIEQYILNIGKMNNKNYEIVWIES